MILSSSFGGRDAFEVEGAGGKVVLRGSSGVAIASALNWYLSRVTRCQLSLWGDRLALLRGRARLLFAVWSVAVGAAQVVLWLAALRTFQVLGEILEAPRGR